MGMSELYCRQCKLSEYKDTTSSGRVLRCSRRHKYLPVDNLVCNCVAFTPERKEDAPKKTDAQWRAALKAANISMERPYDPIYDQPFNGLKHKKKPLG